MEILVHIYMIECKKSGKKYIGSSISEILGARIKRHKYELRKGIHLNQYMQSSWNLYGSDSFDFSIVEIVEFDKTKTAKENEIIIRVLEDEWIHRENTLAPHGFNCKTAELCVPTQETRQKMSIAQLNRPPVSAETRQKLSAKHKGRVFSEDTKKKLRDAQSGEKSYWYGKAHSESTRQKMSKSQSGRIITDEHRENLRQANLKQNNVECPHCGKIGKIGPMSIWHFNKCKLAPK